LPSPTSPIDYDVARLDKEPQQVLDDLRWQLAEEAGLVGDVGEGPDVKVLAG